MYTNLAGKIAVVSSAASGIGYATVEMLIAEGAHVVGGDHSPEPLTALGSRALPVKADLSTDEGNQVVIEAAVAEFDGIPLLNLGYDVLVTVSPV